MSEWLGAFVLLILVLLIGFNAGLPNTVYMSSKDLENVSSKCDKNSGIDYFTTYTYKVVCKDGAVFKLQRIRE